jgi:hypothetical protein
MSGLFVLVYKAFITTPPFTFLTSLSSAARFDISHSSEPHILESWFNTPRFATKHAALTARSDGARFNNSTIQGLAVPELPAQRCAGKRIHQFKVAWVQ